MNVDIGPANVSGAVRARRARVLWSEGVLYVVHSARQIQKVVTTEPVLEGQVWRTESEDGLISFTTFGCPRCGYQLYRLTVDQIINGVA